MRRIVVAARRRRWLGRRNRLGRPASRVHLWTESWSDFLPVLGWSTLLPHACTAWPSPLTARCHRTTASKPPLEAPRPHRGLTTAGNGLSGVTSATGIGSGGGGGGRGKRIGQHVPAPSAQPHDGAVEERLPCRTTMKFRSSSSSSRSQAPIAAATLVDEAFGVPVEM